MFNHKNSSPYLIVLSSIGICFIFLNVSLQVQSLGSNTSCPPISWPALTRLVSAVYSHTVIIYQDNSAGRAPSSFIYNGFLKFKFSDMPAQFLEYLHETIAPVVINDCGSYESEEKLKFFLLEIRAKCYAQCIFIVQCNLTLSRRIIRHAADFEILRPWMLWIFIDPLALELINDIQIAGVNVPVAVPIVDNNSSATKIGSCPTYNTIKVFSLNGSDTNELGIFYDDWHKFTFKEDFSSNPQNIFSTGSTPRSNPTILNLLNGTLKVAAKLLTPFLEIDNSNNSQSLYRGICKKILDAFAKAMNFQYEITRMEYIGTKHITETGHQWDGIIGDIIKGKIDIAVGAITITEERAEVVDFMNYFVEDTSSILSRSPQPLSRILIFYRVFPWQVWLLLFVSIFILGFTLMTLEKFSHNTDQPQQNDKYTVWKCWWSLTISTIQKGEVAPLGIASRALTIFWLMFLIVLIGTYSGVLLSVMSFPSLQTPMEYLRQFEEPNSPFPLALKGSSTYQYIDAAETAAARSVKKRWLEKPTLILPTTPEDLPNILLTGHYALLSERLIFQKLTRLSQSGIIQHWLKETIPNIKQCRDTKQTPDMMKAMSLLDMQGAFYILIIGLGISTIALAVELGATTQCRAKNKAKEFQHANKGAPVLKTMHH